MNFVAVIREIPAFPQPPVLPEFSQNTSPCLPEIHPTNFRHKKTPVKFTGGFQIATD